MAFYSRFRVDQSGAFLSVLADTSSILECIEQIGSRVFALFRAASWWFWIFVFALFLYFGMREQTLVVLPVSVPSAFVEAGYSPQRRLAGGCGPHGVCGGRWRLGSNGGIGGC